MRLSFGVVWLSVSVATVAACGLSLESNPIDTDEAGAASSSGRPASSSSSSGDGATSSSSGSASSSGGSSSSSGSSPCSADQIKQRCEERAAECGTITDDPSCGTFECGACVAPRTCGGAAGANRCGCTPNPNACQGKACGTTDDGCGQTIECGAGRVCGEVDGDHFRCEGNDCVACKSKAEACADRCGQLPNGADGCGGTYDCGNPCAAPDTCGGGGGANTCGCTPRSRQKVCEFIYAGDGQNHPYCSNHNDADGCGGTVDCSAVVCPNGWSCQSCNVAGRFCCR